LLLACTPAPRMFLQYGAELKRSDLEKVLAEQPLDATENIKVTTLGRGKDVSHHVVQVRDREKPHLHQAHDGTVCMVKGQGYLMMDKTRIELAAGDVVYISRGVPHYFVNTATRPSVAFVVFAPPFDGKDIVPTSP